MTLKNGRPCICCGTSAWYDWGNCKQCARNRTKKWRIDNPVRRAELDRKRYHANRKKYQRLAKKWRQNNKDKISEKNKKWRDENPDYLKDYYQKNKKELYQKNRKRVKENRERNREYKRKWKKKNPEQNKIDKHKRRARKNKAGGYFTIKEWQQLCNKYDNKCLCCGKKRKLTVDHIVPIANGGTSNISNIQPLCGICNSKKGIKETDYR